MQAPQAVRRGAVLGALLAMPLFVYAALAEHTLLTAAGVLIFVGLTHELTRWSFQRRIEELEERLSRLETPNDVRRGRAELKLVRSNLKK